MTPPGVARHRRQGAGQPGRHQLPFLPARTGSIREVLRASFRALTEHRLCHAEETKAMSREQALTASSSAIQLWPLLARDELGRHLRIFNWEAVRPTAVFRKLMSEEARRSWGFAVDLVRRCARSGRPHAHDRGGLAGRAMQHLRAQPRAALQPAGVAAPRRSQYRTAGGPRDRPGRSPGSGSGLKGPVRRKSPGLPQKFLVPGQRPPITDV